VALGVVGGLFPRHAELYSEAHGGKTVTRNRSKTGKRKPLDKVKIIRGINKYRKAARRYAKAN
jgi:hypothetical protein